MTEPILKLFAFFVVLFAVLIGWTSRWTVFEAKSLQRKPDNKRTILEALQVKRGTIYAADGKTVLARAVKKKGGIYGRVYPQGDLFAQPVGYAIVSQARYTGLEASRRDALEGGRNELGSIIDQLRGVKREGNDVVTTLDVNGTKVARDALGGRNGSVVALDPRTGAVLVMYSNPTYDPNDPSHGGSQFNASTQAGYPPGSTFKTVTSAAALDTGRYTPNSTINGKSPIIVSGVPLANDDHVSYGPITFTTALTNSVNTVFAQVAVALGRKTMGDYMNRFGFNHKPQLDYPSFQLAPSGEYQGGCGHRLLPETSPLVDLGRLGIGQDKLCVTPLQMAEVAAAVANGGKLMRPHLTAKVIDPDGRTVDTIQPRVQADVMSEQHASELNEMMRHVVQEGTGTAAALSGINVAGKTGTAQIDPSRNITQPWFIAFAPAEDPKVAVAVTIERSDGGFGGTVAAPVAKQVMETLLGEGR